MKKYQILKPDYYDSFTCKGPACKNTCCKGWDIHLSKEEVRRIRLLLQENPALQVSDIFKKRPSEKRSKNADFQLTWSEKGTCQLFSEEGLCQLHRDYGGDSLPKVCRMFPRNIYGYGNTYFHTLSLGCEKVLEILFNSSGKIALLSSSELINGDIGAKKIIFSSGTGVMEQELYFNILNFCMALLQAEDIDFEDRLILLGIGLRQVDELIAKGRALEVPRYCDDYLCSLERIEDIGAIVPKCPENSAVLLSNVLVPVWTEPEGDEDATNMLAAIKETLKVFAEVNDDSACVSYSAEIYDKLRNEYKTFMADKDSFIENVMVAFVFFFRVPFHTDLSKSVWENYMYFVWLFSTVKFMLTACMPQIRSDEDLINCLVIIFRMWGHSKKAPQLILQYLHENSCDDLAHLALLIKSC